MAQNPTVYETSHGKRTGSYDEVIVFYTQLAAKHPTVSIVEMGETDTGIPLHLVVFDPQAAPITKSDLSTVKGNRNTLLILNGIHPGEPDGIDATMLYFRDLAENKVPIPQKTLIATIPVYNIGGFLNRKGKFRPNQEGPEVYGFRGNDRNYDLNRDFIKAETKNAQSFIEIFSLLDPDLLIDNHVSNGADYQYTLTHLFTQHNKLGGELGAYLHQEFLPDFEKELETNDWPIVPYVSVYNQKPEVGYTQFYDSPRYSTGYAALYNTLGMMVETHMLKPYKDRVEGTYELMKTFVALADKDAARIAELRQNSFNNYFNAQYYPTDWKVDSSRISTLNFKGFEADWIPSKITGLNRLKFDRTRPFTKDVPYYNYYKPTDSVKIPTAYVVPRAYWDIRERLERNNIAFTVITKDTMVESEVYRIEDFKTIDSPFEGHYLHFDTEVSVKKEQTQIREGDLWIPVRQRGMRYLLETLEPMSKDSFFNWNFFDAILQQKEGFSPYAWEDMAYQFLEENPNIKEAFEKKRHEDPVFKANSYRQLEWIHKNSPYYETSHRRYPVIRIVD